MAQFSVYSRYTKFCISTLKSNLAYNPGSGAHGRQVVDMSDKKCTHKLNTLCQSINNGNSTIQRAKDRGFKVWISPQPTKLEYWIYDNRMYFFTVTK